MAITSFCTSDLSLGDRKLKSWNGLIRLKILFNKVLLKKYKQMLLTSTRIRHMKSMVNFTLQITTMYKNVIDRRITATIFCIISEVAPKSPSTPEEYFCKEICIFTHSRLSIMNDSHCLDNMHINTAPRHTLVKQTWLMKGTASSNLESTEAHGMAAMQTTENFSIKKKNNPPKPPNTSLD